MMEAAKVLSEATALRTSPVPEFTVADAIQAAQFYRANPDVLVDGPKAKLVIGTLLAALEASPCYFKAARLGLPSFTLLPWDKAGHAAIEVWCQLAESHGCRPEKVAQMRAVLMQWRIRSDLKWPD